MKTLRSALIPIMILVTASLVEAQTITLRIEPAQVSLVDTESQQQLIVTQVDGEQQSDATSRATFESANPQIATVDDQGVVHPIANGTTIITAKMEAVTTAVQVTVQGAGRPRPIHFINDIVPLLSKAGCNSGGCHGKQAGQNGFKLSLFGFDPDADHDALVREGRGRRVFPAAPESSLLLAKVTNQTPHGGGRRFARDSRDYDQFLRWIREGVSRRQEETATLDSITIAPPARVLSPGAQQQVMVTAKYSDGTTRDVTHLSIFTTNDDARASVDEQGLIQTTELGGEAAVMANFMGYVAAMRITVPVNPGLDVSAKAGEWNSDHYIDRLVATKWEKLKLLPSDLCDDATFLRRVSLDCIGKLPTAEESRNFLADNSVDKRKTLVDELLRRDEYADYWALKWADVLRVNSEQLGAKNAHLFDSWLRESFRQNMPYDELVRQLITAQGSSFQNRATNFYKALSKPNDLSIAVSQIFLGVRLECAQCHHHPYEKWGQDDFYGLAAFFPNLQRKKGAGGDELLFPGGKSEVKHPRSGEVVAPQVLGGDPLEVTPEEDRRSHLADWMVSDDNPFVARALVNRVWAHFMGRGLVEPIDDMRDTNPATNEPLLDALAKDFVDHKFDLKHLIRAITSTDVYRLSSVPNQWNRKDTFNFSRAYRKRIPAEVLLDAVSDVTGVPEQFAGVPPGTRAVQLWNNRLPSSFLDVFGRPERKTVCECERSTETSLAQVLHLMNAPLVNDKIQSPTGRAAQLARSELSNQEIITQLYHSAFARIPTQAELETAVGAYASPESTRRSATEDVLWALMNTAEFVLNH